MKPRKNQVVDLKKYLNFGLVTCARREVRNTEKEKESKRWQKQRLTIVDPDDVLLFLKALIGGEISNFLVTFKVLYLF